MKILFNFLSGKLIFVIAATFMLCISCNPRYYNVSHLEKMQWVEGTWSSTEQGLSITEQWKYIAESGFQGINSITAGKDTIYKETTQIKPGPKRSIVFTSAYGQVQIEEYAPMKLISLKKKSFTFQTEDKLKTISYTNKKGNAIQIEINEKTGENPGKTKYQLNKVQ